jgi:uncharacterized Zn-binding protein involved in type VI secretion
MSGKPAARVSDPTACPIPGHGSNPIVAGSPDVLFDSLPAARMGDPTGCGSSLASAVIPNVLINGKPATTIGTVGSHGNVVVGGSGTVIIGNMHSPAAFAPPISLLTVGFDQQFILTDEAGNPIADRHYILIRADGRQETGVTNSQGLTHRLARHDQAEQVDIYISAEGV